MEVFLECCDIENEASSWAPVPVIGWVARGTVGGIAEGSVGGSGNASVSMSITDAVAKIKIAVHQYTIGRGWETACESRWTHTMKLKKRFLLLSMGNGVVVNALRDVQLAYHADESMEASLARIIQPDKGIVPVVPS